VVTIQGVEERPTGLLAIDQAVICQAVQHLENSPVRFPSHKACDLSSRQRSARAGENIQHRAI
jgi:hypothetical protein